MLRPADLGLEPELDRLCAWFSREPEALRRRVAAEGALWLEGLPAPDAAAFARIVRAFSPEPRRYVLGQSDRRVVEGSVYTSTAYPARERVTLHPELSYLRDPPRWLLFHCERAPDAGGETPLACGAALLDALPADLVRRWVEKGLRYHKHMHGGQGFGKSWQRHFETEDRLQVEAVLREEGARYAWTDDGGLSLSLDRPAVRFHPELGRPVWISQAALWHPSNLGLRGEQLRRVLGEDRLPTHVCFGDGSEIPVEDLEIERETAFEVAIIRPWKAGDICILDNHRVLHGRMPFNGERRLHVAMA